MRWRWISQCRRASRRNCACCRGVKPCQICCVAGRKAPSAARQSGWVRIQCSTARGVANDAGSAGSAPKPACAIGNKPWRDTPVTRTPRRASDSAMSTKVSPVPIHNTWSPAPMASRARGAHGSFTTRVVAKLCTQSGDVGGALPTAKIRASPSITVPVLMVTCSGSGLMATAVSHTCCTCTVLLAATAAASSLRR